MADRKQIRLDDRNLIAGAQIMSWIALPHRPEFGVSLLNQWFLARRKFRGEKMPDELPFDLKKPSRLEPQLAKFEESILKGIRAGVWFDWKVMSGSQRPPMFANMNYSTRRLASLRAGHRDTELSNEIRDVWSLRKPVAHLASSFGMTLGTNYREEGRDGFDLERALFNPDWVTETIVLAESRVEVAERMGAFIPATSHQFHRDNF